VTDADLSALSSPRALTCRKQHRTGDGVGDVWFVLLADGYLIDCGAETISKARANILAEIINEAGPSRLDRTPLWAWRRA
jgi:hypothetical protein